MTNPKRRRSRRSMIAPERTLARDRVAARLVTTAAPERTPARARVVARYPRRRPRITFVRKNKRPPPFETSAGRPFVYPICSLGAQEASAAKSPEPLPAPAFPGSHERRADELSCVRVKSATHKGFGSLAR